MRLRRLLVFLLAALVIASCTPPPQAVVRSDLDALMYGDVPASRTAVRVAQMVPVRAPAIPMDDGPYTLDSGDKLRIVVFGQDPLSNTYQVDANGQIAMPLIGAVTARGLTTTQLSGAIQGRLKQSYLRDPSVAVEIETYRPFFILGEVGHPGQYPYVAKMTVENAVAIAGGFTPRASKGKVSVTRKLQGYPTKFTLPMNYPVQPGDIITVSERWF